MPTDVRSQLQATLSGSYTLERELSGGGMSHVFVAEETRLGRKVVVKVLSSELAASLSAERFEREIRVAASLQQANIVPVLSAGDAGGLPYYTMPFVEGESLRKKLAAGPLPITKTVGVLKDVARALSYAHEHGVVHRDIKPDNVLLSGGAAVVTDFGIAKAISASRTGPGAGTLTQIGTSIGTPAYMAPEQAAGDPGVDHRADIYAFACLAYELLAGRSPFSDRSPQRMLAAHMHEAPVHVAELRPDVPPALGELVMRCLAKDPDARIQSASDVLHTLDTMTSAGTHAPMPSILMGGPGMLRKALLLYVGAFVVVAIVARAAIVAIGLPDWVFPGALIVMALGLPVILFTAYVNHVTRQIALTTAPTITPGGTPSTTHGTLAQLAVKASPHVSWRRAALGGAYALGFLALLVVAYMSMRALGVGPIGSLLAKGTLQKNERILVADFRNTGPDTLLGTIVTEAFRTGLGQSQSIVVMPATAVRDVLRRMQRSSGAHVDFNLAREVATREGMKAFVDGEVLSVGGKYLISARLIETMTGNPLVALQESADSDREILTAIDRLTKRLRERVGESLRSVREARPLEQVTTPSLEALRKYVQGSRALSFEGDYNKGVALLEEAIALDGAFAMAYRRLSVELSNRGGQPVRTMELIKKAYDHRDRLSDAERYLTVGTYYMFGPQQDAGRAISAYESLIDLQPDNVTALNNVAVVYQMTRDFQRAQTVVKHAASLFDAPAVVFANLGSVGIALGDTAQAFRAIRAAETRFPSNAFTTIRRAQYLHALGMTDSAVTLALSVRRTQASEATGVANATMLLAEISQLRGRLADAKRWLGEHREAQLRRGGTAAILEHGIALARIDVSLANSPAAQRGLDRAMESQPIASVPHVARPYPQLVALLTTLGRTDGAKALVALFDKERAFVSRIEDDQVRYQMLGDIAMAERRYLEAIQEYRQADRGICIVCALPRLARAYDRAGNADSAIAVYTRYLETPDPFRFATPRSPGADAEYLAPSYLRLGELWEQKRDVLKAHNYYLKFVDLWKNADPELQPRVAEVRRRIARLKDIEGK